VSASIHETLGAAVNAVEKLPEPLSSTLLGTAQQAFVDAIQLNAGLGVIGFVCLAMLTATILRHMEPHMEEAESPVETESGGSGLVDLRPQLEAPVGD
jgi:hypothetical protein